jgi:NAD(P)-binding Rossmann-like domain
VQTIDTDYLVIGAGATGMSFTDALIDADHDCDVVMVDRRDAPGGHWNDAYPFVRLHQAAACYGVNSRPLGNDQLEERGLNAGLYQRADGVQICEYFRRVMDDHHVASGQVRFFPMSNYLGLEGPEVAFVATLTGATTEVKVRRAVVDARYLEPTIPSRHSPSFAVDPDVRCVPVNDLADVREPATGYTVVGGGKTGSDACTWLLERGVDPDNIRWIRARDAWMWNRAQVQPLELVTDTIDGVSRSVEASAEAESIEDLFSRLEACGQLLRLDRSVAPTMYHAATLTVAELERLRTIEHVVRLGHIKSIRTDAIELEQGTIPTDHGQLHIDCSAAGLGKAPGRPIFEPGRITLQCISTVFPTFNASVIGYLEASRGRDEVAKFRLSPTNRYPDAANDWIPNMRGQLESLRLWNAETDLAAWLESSRLNIARGMMKKASEPRMAEAITRLLTYTDGAVANLEELGSSQRA